MHRFGCASAALAAALLTYSPAYTQEVRATLSGIITDSSGAPVQGASVTLTNVDRNASTPSETMEANGATTKSFSTASATSEATAQW